MFIDAGDARMLPGGHTNTADCWCRGNAEVAIFA